MAEQPPHFATVRTVEALAGDAHALAFIIAEHGLTEQVQVEGDRIADAVMAAVHG